MNSSEFIKHVKDSIVNSERVTFEIDNFPATLDQEGKKSLLDMVYRTIKSPKSSEDQKRVALKIFKQCLIVPKNTDLINMFIKCQMWDIFMAQFREFKRNPSSERLSGYSTGYFLILEDFLEGCKDVLGVDSLNNETPFSKFWNAVISPDPNPGFTRLVSLVAAMQGPNPRSVGSVSAELGRRDGGYQLAGFVNSFLEEHPLAKRLQAGEALSEYEVLLVKAQFFNFAEEEFFFGFADPKAYGVLSEVVELEAQREIGRVDPRQLQTALQKIEAEPIKRFTRNWNLAQNDLPHPQSAPLRPQTVGVSPLESRPPEAAVSTLMTPAEHARNLSRFNQVQPSILPGVSNYSVRSATSEEVAMMQRDFRGTIGRVLSQTGLAMDARHRGLNDVFSQEHPHSLHQPIQPLSDAPAIFSGSCKVASTSSLIGKVELGENVIVSSGCTLNAIELPIRLDEGAVVSEGAVLISRKGDEKITGSVNIGKNVFVGEKSIVNGCLIDEDAFIGRGVFIGNGVMIEKGAKVLDFTLVPNGAILKADTVYGGAHAEEIRKISDEDKKEIAKRLNSARSMHKAIEDARFFIQMPANLA